MAAHDILHPRHGRGRLPGDESLPSNDDSSRLRRILESATHRRADRDLDLLGRPELRPLRLQLEFLKPELAFQDRGIEHTIVVFGSSRIPAPEVAARVLEHARREGAEPGERRAAERLVERSRFYEIAREFGRIVGRAGRGRAVLATGGGPGLMEAANRGASDVGAPTIGLGIVLPREQQPNPFLSPELSFQFRYFALRKMHFMLRARALVAFPGGYGTFDEVFETLCLVQTGKREAIPVVLVGREFWDRAVDFAYLVSEGVIEPGDLDLFAVAESAEEIWSHITGWYGSRGRSVFG
jgi:uncharacterized protein (TIGR00730 family)